MEPLKSLMSHDTITAIATPAGTGGIAVIRISGPETISIVSKAWMGKDLKMAKSHSLHYGSYISVSGELLDDCVASVFIGPNSFTGEDTVELSVHGSPWIQREIIIDLIKRGARMAEPGEFTQRAFINGKLDLAQAEGVADLIASSSKASHDLAINQTKGTFSKEFECLREKLIEFASLMELELDFSEEDVEFADRRAFFALCNEILQKTRSLADSYSTGSVLKEGVPVVLAGIPNAGKSSILNMLLNDEKAIVTEIPGTTRDIIEGTREFDGILYRLIDTAGLRETSDLVEGIGVERAHAALQKAFIIIWVIDGAVPYDDQISELNKFKSNHPDKAIIILRNKADLNENKLNYQGVIDFSTRTLQGQETLIKKLHELATAGKNPEKDIIITNARHYEALTRATESLERVKEGLNGGLSSDLIAQDLREAITEMATITGSITNDTLLSSIFSRFCIGK